MTAVLMKDLACRSRIGSCRQYVMTAMEDRKRFTYRYDDETEKLLLAGLEEFELSSLNKLIDKLIVDDLVRFPEEQKTMKQEIKDLQDSFKKCQGEKEQIEIHLTRLKAALKRDFENKETINKLMQ
jgi:septal ring factor EnvC (AmiA/AmiB activator)